MTWSPEQLVLPGFDLAEQEWQSAYDAQIGDDKIIRNRSAIKIKPLYSPSDWDGSRYLNDLGFPGSQPYTRGIYPSMHRGRSWSQRQLIGLGTPKDYNRRTLDLIDSGVSAISLIPCNSVFRGYDCDQIPQPLLGTCGTVVNTTDHMDDCLREVSMVDVSTAVNDPTPFTLLAFMLAVAKRRGVNWDQISGTSNQSDYLSHCVANHMFFRLSLPGARRVLIDHINFCRKNLPNWYPVSIVGQHMQQAGATPAEAMGFTLCSAIQIANDCIASGLGPDDVLPRFTFFFDTSISFFEEIAKYRAGRRVWAKISRERLGAKDPRSWRFKFHAQTSGVDLTLQQPLNNISRISVQAIASIFGGLQSMHTDSFDEAISTPSEEAALIAIATQNILRSEAHLCDVIDPLGGSYYLEALTNQMEEKIESVIAMVDAAGGMYTSVEQGLVQRKIGDSALAFQSLIESGEQPLVGVNAYTRNESDLITAPVKRPDRSAMKAHVESLELYKKERPKQPVRKALDRLRRAASSKNENVFARVVEAAEAGVTHGEIVACLREELGDGIPVVVP